MKHKLNTRLITTLKPKKKTYEIYDTEIRGLAVRVTSNGRKSFCLRYSSGKKRRRYKLCDFSSYLPMDEVRKLASKRVFEVFQGIDIQAEKHKKWREDRKNMTMEELCEEYMKKGSRHKALSTQYIDNIRINRHIIPTIGKKKLHDLTKSDVVNMKVDISDRKTAEYAKKIDPASQVQGGKAIARDTVKTVKIILNYAIDQRYITNNPATKIKLSKQTVKRIEPFSKKELISLSKQLSKKEKYGKAVDVIRLILLTGCRRNEIESLRWKDVDFDKRVINLSNSKTGRRTVYLGTYTVEFLEKLKTANPSDFVFQSERKRTFYKNTSKQWQRIRKAAKLQKPDCHCRIHDLRHTYASTANDLGYTERTIAALLGHSKGNSTTAGYIHVSKEASLKAAEDITSVIVKRLQGEDSD